MNIININTYSQMSIKYNKKDKWKNFARRITKNSFVKQFLASKYKCKCQFCNDNFEDFVVHHMDYDHECKYEECINISHSTSKRPNSSRKVPNCEKCYNESIDNFNDCMSRLVPVHQACNYKISIVKRDDFK